MRKCDKIGQMGRPWHCHGGEAIGTSVLLNNMEYQPSSDSAGKKCAALGLLTPTDPLTDLLAQQRSRANARPPNSRAPATKPTADQADQAGRRCASLPDVTKSRAFGPARRMSFCKPCAFLRDSFTICASIFRRALLLSASTLRIPRFAPECDPATWTLPRGPKDIK